MKRLYHSLAVIAGLAFSYSAIAQQAAPTVFTLEQCIEYAKKNAIPTRNAELDEEIAKSKVKETIGIGLPQVSGSFSVDHNEKLRRFFYAQNPSSPFYQPISGVNDGDIVAAQN